MYICRSVMPLISSVMGSDRFYYLIMHRNIFSSNSIPIFGSWIIKIPSPELSATTFAQAGSGTDLLTKKYMASHTLQVHLFPKLTVGIFETVLFHRKDHFEFQYLNPVILYRSVEGAIGVRIMSCWG